MVPSYTALSNGAQYARESKLEAGSFLEGNSIDEIDARPLD